MFYDDDIISSSWHWKWKVKSELHYGMPYSTFLHFCVIVSVCHLERSLIFKACLETLIALRLDVRLHKQTYADIILDVSTQWVFSAMPDLPLTTYWSGPHNSQQSSPLASLSSILCTTGYGTPFWTRLSQKMRELCKLIPPMTMHYEELLPHIFSGFLSFLIGNILHPRIMSHPT